MKRKINRVGQNTLTVSLPSKWAQMHGLKPGDDVEVAEEGSSIRISAEAGEKRYKKAVINVDEFDRLMLNRFLDEFYREGIEEIQIRFSRETMPYYKQETEIDLGGYLKEIIEKRFLGWEIISKTSKSITLQSFITQEEYEKIDAVQRRVYFLIKEFFDEFAAAMNGDFKKFNAKIYDYHDNIHKFTNYYLRLLNFSDLSIGTKGRLIGAFTVIDKMIDKARHTSERLNEMKKINDKIKSYLKDIFALFISQFDLILNKEMSFKDIDSLVKKRYSIVKRVNSEKFSIEEERVISECKIMLDTIDDFCGAYAALQLHKYVDAL